MAKNRLNRWQSSRVSVSGRSILVREHDGYNHAQHLPERRKMMQWWADYLAGLANGKSND
jgi:hypothetical protein